MWFAAREGLSRGTVYREEPAPGTNSFTFQMQISTNMLAEQN